MSTLSQPSAEADGHAPPPLRILVVDDSHDVADSLAMLLTLLGHQVRVAYDGPAALHLAETLLPQVVLLDLGLPGMDGCEVARRLRDRVALQDTCLIASTGCDQDEDRRSCHEAGFDHFLLKPYDPGELQRVLTGRVHQP
jgi:CheY-like chemotaxis protein